MYNPLFIWVSFEGGRKINCRIEKESNQKFIAMTQKFPVEIFNDAEDESISDFWSLCYQQGIVDMLKNCRDAEDHRIFGLCGPFLDDALYFEYGIGIFVKDEKRLENLLYKVNQQAGYQKLAPFIKKRQ